MIDPFGGGFGSDPFGDGFDGGTSMLGGMESSVYRGALDQTLGSGLGGILANSQSKYTFSPSNDTHPDVCFTNEDDIRVTLQIASWKPRTLNGELILDPEYDNTGKRTKGSYSDLELEVLLAYLSKDGNYKKMKTGGDEFWKTIEQDIFRRSRSWSAIKKEWERLRANVMTVNRRLNSTGEGIKPKEQWYALKGIFFSRYDH